MNIPLSPRLAACAALVPQGSRVADIGCDHGYLGLHLLETGRAAYVYAADIHEGPLQSALRNAEKYGYGQQMSFYLSDGVCNVPQDFDVLICAGMGADTIVSILDAAPWLKNDRYRLVLQCQSKTPSLRRYLTENGWQIPEETVLRDGKFLYTVMLADYASAFHRGTPGQWYFPPGILGTPRKKLAAYYRWVVKGLRIATDHKADPEKAQALAELEALAKTPALQFLQEDDP